MRQVASQSRKQAVFGLTLAIVLILKVSIPYLVIASLCLWLANRVQGFDDAWGWGLMGAMLLGFLMFKARSLENARRASPFSWHQGHYWAILVAARAGLSLLSIFRVKSGPDIRRESGYEKNPIEKGEADADPIRRRRRELGYEDPPPDS